MDKRKYINFNTTKDFILDKEFTHWVLNQDKDIDLIWTSFIEEHPEKDSSINNAILIIKSIQPIGQEISENKLIEILHKVKTSKLNKYIRLFSYFKYAAGVAIVIGISSLLYLSISIKDQFPLKLTTELNEYGKVILANGSIKKFDTKQTTLGGLNVKNNTIEV